MHDTQVVLAPFAEDLVILTRSAGVDPRLSLADRGLLWALFARSSRAPISIPDLASDLSTTESEISACMSHLIECGYVDRLEIRVKGRFAYQYRVYPTRQEQRTAQQQPMFTAPEPEKPKRARRSRKVESQEPVENGKAPSLIASLNATWSQQRGVVVPQSQWPRITRRMKELIADTEGLGLDPERLGGAITSVYREMSRDKFWIDVMAKSGQIPFERVAERALVWLQRNPSGVEGVEIGTKAPPPDVLISGAVTERSDRGSDILSRLERFKSKQ